MAKKESGSWGYDEWRNFLIETPLFIKTTVNDKESFSSLIGKMQFDTHCVWCNCHTTFKLKNEPFNHDKLRYHDENTKKELQLIQMECQRINSHVYNFIYNIDWVSITKIGQFPSPLDLMTVHLKPISRFISKDDYRDLRRAVELSSHNYNIGSYVYLRRVFERFIDNARRFLKGDAVLSDDAWKSKSVREKVASLSETLPDIIVRNKSIYGPISEGIHSLEEDQCAKYFPVLFGMLTYMSRHYLRTLDEEREIKELEESLGGIGSELGSDEKDAR